jgi:hypothetical protein
MLKGLLPVGAGSGVAEVPPRAAVGLGVRFRPAVRHKQEPVVRHKQEPVVRRKQEQAVQRKQEQAVRRKQAQAVARLGVRARVVQAVPQGVPRVIQKTRTTWGSGWT